MITISTFTELGAKRTISLLKKKYNIEKFTEIKKCEDEMYRFSYEDEGLESNK